MTTFRTQADLQALLDAVAEMRTQLDKLAVFGRGANAAMWQNAHSPEALAFGLAALQVLHEQFQAVLAQFEHHAVRMLGEPRWPGELGTDYVERINKLDAEATMRKNGIVLLPW